MTTEETRAVAAVPDTGPVAGSAPAPDDDVLAPPVPRRAPLMLLLGLVFFFGPAVAFAGGARPHQIENRPLTAFPSVDKGWPFLDGLNSWANDHLPLRGKAISANTRLSESVFGQPPQYGGSTSGAVITASTAPAIRFPCVTAISANVVVPASSVESTAICSESASGPMGQVNNHAQPMNTACNGSRAHNAHVGTGFFPSGILWIAMFTFAGNTATKSAMSPHAA